MADTPTAGPEPEPRPRQVDPPPAPPEPRGRGRQTVGDMLRSMAVVLLVVGVVVVLALRDEPEDPVREVDVTGPLAAARAVAPYDVKGPVALGPGWRPTSVRSGTEGDAFVWHVGFVTPHGDYAGLEQTDGDLRDFIDRFAEGAERAGRQRIGDHTWRRLTGGAPEPRGLLLQEGAVATLVVGGADWAELAELAASLRGG